MKIRNGFVSNSSSSSFIVKFPRVPKSVNDVKEMLFGNEKKYYSPYDDESWNTQEVAKVVFKDIKDQNANDMKEAIELVSCNCPYDYENFKKPNSEDKKLVQKYDYDAYHNASQTWAEEEFEKFYSLKKIRKDKISKIRGENVKNASEIFYIFNYSDNGSTALEGAMEHGNLFKKLEHITINQH